MGCFEMLKCLLCCPKMRDAANADEIRPITGFHQPRSPEQHNHLSNDSYLSQRHYYPTISSNNFNGYTRLSSIGSTFVQQPIAPARISIAPIVPASNAPAPAQKYLEPTSALIQSTSSIARDPNVSRVIKRPGQLVPVFSFLKAAPSVPVSHVRKAPTLAPVLNYGSCSSHILIQSELDACADAQEIETLLHMQQLEDFPIPDEILDLEQNKENAKILMDKIKYIIVGILF